MNWPRLRLAPSIALASLTIISFSPAQENADLIYRNGKILTVDANDAIVKAIAVRGGRIVSTGSNAEVEKFRGDSTEFADLGGACVIPGLIETHVHSIGVARASWSLYRDYLECPEEEIREIRPLRTVVGGQTVFERAP